VIRVLVVDDDPLVRAGLRTMLGGRTDLAVVGEAADGAGAVDATTEHRPDVVLMDLRMPVVDGITATGWIRALPDAPEVLVLTTFQSDEQVLAALRAGASGYLLKDTPPQDIVTAVLRVADGEPMLSPAVLRGLIAAATGPADDTGDRARARLAELAERERDVAVEVGRGRSNAEIAAELHMSIATVKSYVSRILTKLDLTNRTQIALLAHDAFPD
jgi:DNA-binding NarL/FixJ family response regulator